jgi:thioredoxin reductase
MTAPVNLPIVGKVKMHETTKEALLEFWKNIEKETGLSINYNERVESITKSENGYEVKTSRNLYQARTVLLTIGRRGTPRKLGVPGEELPKVVYRLIDPEQYRGQHVLVVGGGDSALEAATSIAAEDNTKVTLSYRGEGFARAKDKNRKKVETAQANGNLDVLLESTVKNVSPGDVTINHNEQEVTIPNDGIIVCAGGILPTKFLQDTGIIVETRHGSN